MLQGGLSAVERPRGNRLEPEGCVARGSLPTVPHSLSNDLHRSRPVTLPGGRGIFCSC